MFEKAGADGDGSVTAAEMDAAHASKDGKRDKSSAEKIQKLDTDGDGALSATEHAAGAREKMTKVDTDGDGNISQAEFQAKKDR